MKNIFKIWIFTAIFLLKRRKYFKKFKQFEEKKKEQEIFKLLKEFDDYILNKLKIDVEIISNEELNLSEPVLFVANHPSMLDPMFLLKVIDSPVSFFVAQKGKVILKIPYGKNFYKYMHNVYIDRASIKSGVLAIKEGKQRLSSGFNLMIFPEGQITKVISQEEVGEFKGGSFKTAMDEKKAIVPISIIGAETIQEKPSIFSPINSQKVILKVHKKIEYEEIKNFKTKDLADYIKKIIQEPLQGGKK